jgi:N-acetylglucosaminyldiphosphoundecaprenol N-acetyl-beta-D-mannosaminyltransferase
MKMNRDRIKIFNQTFYCINTSEAIEQIGVFITRKESKIICAKNVALTVDCLKDDFLFNFYEDADMVTVDGRVLVLFSRIYPISFPEMVGGPNLWVRLLEHGDIKSLSIYLLGSTQSLVEKAVSNLSAKYQGLNFVGYNNGYFNDAKEEIIINNLKQLNPDIILLGISTPKKEILARKIKLELDSSLIVLVGGMIDVFAGDKKMAPPIISKLCLEWLLRLIQEPKRLWRRYLTTNIIFLRLAFYEAIKELIRRIN